MRKAFFAMIVTGLALMSFSTGKALKDESLVLYLSLDEGMGESAKDQSGKSNDGALSGGAAWTNDGKYKSAIMFDGVDDGVVVSDSDSLDLGDQLTLEAWIYSFDVTGSYKGVISKEDWNNAKGYYLGQNSKKVYFGFNKGLKNEIQGGQIDTNEKWYHIAGTFDGNLASNNLKIYVNGVLAMQGGNSEVPIAHATTLDIGWIHDLSNSYFNGIIDEVAIYRRALTEEEINRDMVESPFSDIAPAGKLATSWGNIKFY